jgi:hypothetical protein
MDLVKEVRKQYEYLKPKSTDYRDLRNKTIFDYTEESIFIHPGTCIVVEEEMYLDSTIIEQRAFDLLTYAIDTGNNEMEAEVKKAFQPEFDALKRDYPDLRNKTIFDYTDDPLILEYSAYKLSIGEWDKDDKYESLSEYAECINDDRMAVAIEMEFEEEERDMRQKWAFASG